MTDSGVTVVPRRVGPVARMLVAVLVWVPLGSLVIPVLDADLERSVAGLVVAGALAGMALAMTTALNHGFAPRVHGSVLEVWTLLGRQTVDLAALTAVEHQHLSWKHRPRLRLKDPVNLVTILPPRGEVRDAVARGVWEAAGRGVGVDPYVPPLLGLPALPGMPDRSASVVKDLAIFGATAVGLSVCAGLGLLVVQLRG